MKSNVKIMVACAAVLAIAGGGYAALTLTEDNASDTLSSVSDEGTEQSSSIPVPLVSFEAENITSVSVENECGKYEAIPVSGGSEDGSVGLTIKDLEDLDIDMNLTSALLDSSCALTSSTTVEESASDLSKYGLKAPRASYTVTAGSERKTVFIGDDSPISGETYCMINGSDKVYTAATSSLSIFLSADTDFISSEILAKPDDDNTPKINRITVKRDDMPYEMTLEYDDSSDDGTTSGTMATHYMTKPIFAYLDPEKSQGAVAGLFGLRAKSVLMAHPAANELETAGLNKPFCTVTMECDDGNSYVLKLGNKFGADSGAYYTASFDGKDVIYALSADDNEWAEITPDDIISRMVFGTYVWDIGKLELNTGGETVKFSGKGTSGSDYKVTKNGKECSAERFQDFYSFLLKTSAEEFSIDEQPEGEPQVSVYLETQNGKTKQTVEFYKADGKKSLICVNGQPSFKCRTAFVDLLIKNLEKFDSDEKFVENW